MIDLAMHVVTGSNPVQIILDFYFFCTKPKKKTKTIKIAATRDRTGDLQIFSLTLSQLSYSGT